MKICVLEPLGIPQAELERLEAPFTKEGHEFAHFERTADVETLKLETADADAVILANMPFPASVIAASPHLRMIDIAFTGVDHVGLDAARARSMVVMNASGYSNEAVAELGIGMIISLLRNLPQVEARCREGGTKAGLVGSELKGKTVGIVGLGAIGRRSAELLHAFGCMVLASSRTRHADCPAYVTEMELDEMLRESDIVLVHCPLTQETRGLIGREKLALMKKTAILVNLARGPVVNAQDLADALNQGLIAAAAIDVFDREPPLDETEPLLHAQNTLLTPHVAFATDESMLLRAQIVFENLRAWMDGKPINVVK